MRHKTAHKLIVISVVLAIAMTLGGWIHGNIVEGYEVLKNNDKVDPTIVDKLVEDGEAKVIVMLKEGKRSIQNIQEDVLRGIEEENFEIEYRYSQISAVSGSLDKEALESLIASDQVEKIYFDKSLKINLDESIPLIDGDEIYSIERNGTYLRGRYQTACVIDTGVDSNHPALAGRVIGGWDYYNNDSDYSDDNSHGTHVAGIIASNDSTYTGVAPEANIIAIKVCDSTGLDCPSSQIIAGIDWCVNNASTFNISVISMSLGDEGEYNSSNCPTTMDSSINNAFANGLFIVASSGNNGHTDGIAYPACSPNITSVGASDNSDNIGEAGGWRTNIGDLLDILAPGKNIRSSVLGTSFGDKSGTSLAVPHVSGATLLLIQNKELQEATITPTEIKARLKTSSINISDSGYVIPRLSLTESIPDNQLELSYEITPYPKTNADVYFVANYTNKTNNASITSATCKVNFADSGNNLMTWNSSEGAYQYVRNFNSPATYSWNVTCNKTNYETLTKISSIEVVQGSENCSYPGSNEPWNLTGTNSSLCVGENLLINQSNINIEDDAEFILRDTNLTLIDASAAYTINITSNGNVTLDNVFVNGYSDLYPLNLDVYGQIQIYNATFNYSTITFFENSSNEIKDSVFKYEFYANDLSVTNITNSIFEDNVFLEDNSTISLINSELQSISYVRNYAQLKLDNTIISTWLFFENNAILNATAFTNLSEGQISFEDNPTIYGEIDMPTTHVVDPGINATRYFPVYVYYSDGTTVYPDKAITIIDNESNVIWTGITNSQGFVEVPQSFNGSNYDVGHFNISVNPTEDLFLLMDTPITVQTTTDAPAGGDGGSGGGGGGGGSPTVIETCEESWTCDPWLACVEGVQRRTCDDANMCATYINRPVLIQGCEENSLDNARGGIALPSGSGEYRIHNDISTNPAKEDCCLWRICGSWYDLCWYLWVIIALVIVSAFIILWKLNVERKRKKKRRHRMASALGIDWILKHTHLK